MIGQDCEQLTLFQGGAPCQPHSLIGKRLAENDDRHLWPEFMRVVQELRPRAVVGENVPGLLSTIHGSVCTDLENADYKVWTFCIPAYSVGAHHERYRLAIVAVAKSQPGFQIDTGTNSAGTQRETRERTVWRDWSYLPGTYWAVHQPPIFGMADGIPRGVDGRVKYKAQMTALGNAVVPQQFYPIFRAIAEIEAQIRPETGIGEKGEKYEKV